METVCAVARRHGLASSQLFTWRRDLRQQLADRGMALPMAPASAPSFVPAVIEPAPWGDPTGPARRLRRWRRSQAGAVELEIDGVAVKIARGANYHVIAVSTTRRMISGDEWKPLNGSGGLAPALRGIGHR